MNRRKPQPRLAVVPVEEGQGFATYVHLADPRDLTEAQIKNLIISSLGNGVEPIGHSQKAHSRK